MKKPIDYRVSLPPHYTKWLQSLPEHGMGWQEVEAIFEAPGFFKAIPAKVFNGTELSILRSDADPRCNLDTLGGLRVSYERGRE